MRFTAITAALGFACAATISMAADPSSQGAAARFKQADANGDGMISKDEARSLPMVSRHFDDIDTNHDGQVTADELRAFQSKAHAEHRGAAAHFRKIDTDGDGKISRAEAQANAPKLAEHFDEIDANKDGFVTPDEMKAARAQRSQASASK